MYTQKVTTSFTPTTTEINKQINIAKRSTPFRKVKKLVAKQNYFELILTQ